MSESMGSGYKQDCKSYHHRESIDADSSTYGYQSIFDGFGIIFTQCQFPFDTPENMDGKIDTQTNGNGRQQCCDNIQFKPQPPHQAKSTKHGKSQRNTANQSGVMLLKIIANNTMMAKRQKSK